MVHLNWEIYTFDEEIPASKVLYNGFLIPVDKFNRIARTDFFNTPTIPKKQMPVHTLERLKSNPLPIFAGSIEDNEIAWINTVENHLQQSDCPPRFWIGKASIHLILEAKCWMTQLDKTMLKTTKIGKNSKETS